LLVLCDRYMANQKLDLVRRWLKKGVRDSSGVGVHVTSIERFCSVLRENGFNYNTAFVPYAESFLHDSRYEDDLAQMPGKLYHREDAIFEDIDNYFLLPVYLDYLTGRGLNVGKLEISILLSQVMLDALSIHQENIDKLRGRGMKGLVDLISCDILVMN